MTAPLFAYVFFGAALTLSPLALGLKLFAILGGSLFVAAAIRWIVGASAIKRHKEAIDGLNILFMLVFVTAVMGTVASNVLADPLKMIGLALFAFAVFFALLGLTTLIFRRIGSEHALALGLMVSQRNMGLMLAATDGVLPGLTWLYFALCQFPIYLSPQLLRPIAGTKVGLVATESGEKLQSCRLGPAPTGPASSPASSLRPCLRRQSPSTRTTAKRSACSPPARGWPELDQ